MRLWHYELVPYLPDLQLKAQWRELQSIFARQNRHILINYVYEYPKLNLWYYTKLVSAEMRKRGMNFSEKACVRADNYFGDITATLEEAKAMEGTNPFPMHHTTRYLSQCFYNLQEKYDRGQKDFSFARYLELESFIKENVVGDFTNHYD